MYGAAGSTICRQGRGALAVDLPGHGRSALDEPITVERFAQGLAATLAQEGVNRAHIVAHSLGAASARPWRRWRRSLWDR